nr:cell death activator CIDE-3-like [Aotus nancymaae]
MTLGTRYQLSLSHKPAKKIDVARVTFDLYKLNPQDFIGCLNMKATFYDTYSLSYDLHCYGAECIMKSSRANGVKAAVVSEQERIVFDAAWGWRGKIPNSKGEPASAGPAGPSWGMAFPRAPA